jgi:hypothetical protein
MSTTSNCADLRYALQVHDVERLRKAGRIFRTEGLDLPNWQDSFEVIMGLFEIPPPEFPEQDFAELRASAMTILRGLAANLPPDVVESQRIDSVLDLLRECASADRLGKKCGNSLFRLKFNRGLPAQLWEKALETLTESFVGLPPQQSDFALINPRFAGSLIRDLFVTADPGDEIVRRTWGRVEPYLNWLSSQPDFYLLDELWEIYEAPGCSAFYRFWHWHKKLLESGRISSEFGPDELELAIELEREGDRVYRWPDERWSGWEWPRDVQQYLALLEKPSPAVRAASAFVVGRFFLGTHKSKSLKAVPPVGQILSFFGDQERRGTGVAGAFLQGAMFGVEDLWKAHIGIDFRDWMFQTLAVGPEPEFTGFQSLAYHAHEYLEASEENLRRLVAIGREDAAILLATEEFGHDPAAEAAFRRTFERWRKEYPTPTPTASAKYPETPAPPPAAVAAAWEHPHRHPRHRPGRLQSLRRRPNLDRPPGAPAQALDKPARSLAY